MQGNRWGQEMTWTNEAENGWQGPDSDYYEWDKEWVGASTLSHATSSQCSLGPLVHGCLPSSCHVCPEGARGTGLLPSCN